MHTRRQRYSARMALLVVVLGIAMLCCASAHLTDHPCCGHRACAICAFLRTWLRPSALRVRLLVTVVMILAAVLRSTARPCASSASPCALRVRLND